jgi:cold shock CspA family protein/ribosome-associated translation inhibitor RaiA
MIIPVQITFRNVASTPEIEEKIRTRAQKLERFYSPITSCRVLVEAPARHREKGYPFHIRIDLTVPEGEIVVKREPTLHAREQDVGGERRRKQMETRPERKHLEVAIREAFHAARRRLQDHARQKRADVKTHEPMPQARVTKLFPVEGYGYIETPDGREIYFHANSVLNNRFKSLKLGSKVSFTEEAGEKGLQASTVHHITRARATAAPPPAITRATRKRKTA